MKHPFGTDRVQTWLLAIIATGFMLIVLEQGRSFLLPLAIAILIFSLLTAAADSITRVRILGVSAPYWLSNIIVISVSALFILIIAGILAGQIDAFAAAAPHYAARVQEIVIDLFSWLGDDISAGLVDSVAEIDFGFHARWVAGSAGYGLTTVILIVIYIGFLMAERSHASRKFDRLFTSPRRAEVVRGVVQSIGSSIRRYILVKTIVSSLTGLLTYAALKSIGVDFAETWGLLAFLLNFIPNIGSIIASVLPTLASMVQFEIWTPVLVVFLGLGTLQFVIGNIVEPMLMGRTLNLSSFAIILSLTFWGAVWGIVGMFLAVPITVMLMIICAHVTPLRPLAVLLSADGEPPDNLPESSHLSPDHHEAG
ncbi:AI-2E family transporter [Fodinicurvata sp. EGI_FJ10296]|uniref:AI-2E family transporter n=1 Tax=Fodinicurvata sp. EGI_FJ10296 TaxID=3231908 RepID=UPI00345597F8